MTTPAPPSADRHGEAYVDIVWRQFKKNRAAHISMWLSVPLFLTALFAPVICSHVPFTYFDGQLIVLTETLDASWSLAEREVTDEDTGEETAEPIVRVAIEGLGQDRFPADEAIIRNEATGEEFTLEPGQRRRRRRRSDDEERKVVNRRFESADPKLIEALERVADERFTFTVDITDEGADKPTPYKGEIGRRTYPWFRWIFYPRLSISYFFNLGMMVFFPWVLLVVILNFILWLRGVPGRRRVGLAVVLFIGMTALLWAPMHFSQQDWWQSIGLPVLLPDNRYATERFVTDEFENPYKKGVYTFIPFGPYEDNDVYSLTKPPGYKKVADTRSDEATLSLEQAIEKWEKRSAKTKTPSADSPGDALASALKTWAALPKAERHGPQATLELIDAYNTRQEEFSKLPALPEDVQTALAAWVADPDDFDTPLDLEDALNIWFVDSPVDDDSDNPTGSELYKTVKVAADEWSISTDEERQGAAGDALKEAYAKFSSAGDALRLDAQIEDALDLWMKSDLIQWERISDSHTHWLGTDDTGLDIVARLVHGTRLSISVGFVAVGIYVSIGIVLGALAGYFGGWVDMTISRMIEVMMMFPAFFLILTLVALIGPSVLVIMVVIGLTGWPRIARLIRGEVLKQRAIDYVSASRALGASHLRVIFRHILPNAISPALVAAPFGIASAIVIEAGLSLLGLGEAPPAPSWGALLQIASRDYSLWWLIVAPSVPIFFTVTVFNLVGSGLRDAMDPRLRV